MTWRSKLSYPQNTTTLPPSWEMQMKMSYIIGNKKYTNKRKCASPKVWYLRERLTRLKFLDSIDLLL